MNRMFFNGLTGRIITPHNPEYNELRQEWNRAIQKYPIALVYCYNKFDVSNALRWCRCHGISFRIRNGGHNYEGYSTGNDLIVIDLSNMNHISFCNQIVRIEGGISNSEIYNYISAQGYPFPGGTCPSVGVSGYALGGGWGLSCRKYGLGCDSLIELEIIDYTGEILFANQCLHSDLFWACRGAGGNNFGIIVSMSFIVSEKVDKVTLIQLYYPNATQEAQELFFSAWQDWLFEVDERITLIASIYHSIEENFAVFSRGIFYGTLEEAEIILKPLTNLPGSQLSLEYISFYDAIKKIGESYPEYEKFKSTGRFVVRPLCPNEISHLVGSLQEVPEGSVFSALSLYALGGKVSEISKFDTAYYYRNAQYIIGLQSVWENDQYVQDNIEWVNRKFRYLESVTAGSYVNFPNNNLVDYLEAYYGENASRLRVIKKIYDPYNVFNFQQSIR